MANKRLQARAFSRMLSVEAIEPVNELAVRPIIFPPAQDNGDGRSALSRERGSAYEPKELTSSDRL